MKDINEKLDLLKELDEIITFLEMSDENGN